jgi:hypothetical protein
VPGSLPDQTKVRRDAFAVSVRQYGGRNGQLVRHLGLKLRIGDERSVQRGERFQIKLAWSQRSAAASGW